MPQKNVFHKKINKKVYKQNNWNSENWLFDDVSKIKDIKNQVWTRPKNQVHLNPFFELDFSKSSADQQGARGFGEASKI